MSSNISIDVGATTETNHLNHSIASAISIDVGATTETSDPNLSIASAISVDGASTTETNHPIFFLLLTVAGFFKEVPHHLLAAAEQLDDDVNQAIPHAQIVVILGSLIGFAGVKAQGDPHFPFKTHNILIKISITSLLFFGIASATQVFAPPTYKGIVRLAKIVCLITSIVSLASPFYF